MVSSSAVHRALINTSRSSAVRAPRSSAQGSRRLVGTASAMSLPVEEQPVLDLQIFDIFDAPSRLGESSKLLAKASSLRPAPVRPARTLSTASDKASPTSHIKPLPAPILYDGPARPRHLAHGATRARRAHTISSSGSLDTPFSLPPPVVFDGPSKLRPYVRGSSSGQSSPSTSTLLLVAASGVVAYATYDQFQQTPPRRRSSVSSN